ncbi:MAG: isoleucine--tRNA ligase [Thermoplasmata archaeon]|nr:isoleucine--tRNA ligase [Thermoplasmata archaeon]
MPEERRSTPPVSMTAIGEAVRGYWERTGVPARLLAGVPGGPEFRFTEGPPTANGPPHLGHVIARTLKDVVLRYKRMRGFAIVSAKGGWDCHGLPVELEVEKRLGLKSKNEIEGYGVDKFSEACRANVFDAIAAWNATNERLGYWLDYGNAYATMRAPYIESVWWSLKTLFDRGLLERGFYVLPYCPRCETPLSSHEVAQGYHETTDPSVTLRVELEPSGEGPRQFLLVWTTTPWTLPANLLVAAREELDYVRVAQGDGTEYLIAAEALARYFPDAPKVAGHLTGRELAGRRYRPWFPFAGDGPGRYRVVLDAMVDAKEGTGFVHIAPSFGVDDQRVGVREGVGAFDPLDSRGQFTSKVPPYQGRKFKDADAGILAELAERGDVVARTTLRHIYPFCWRCDTPLIYRALDSWFVRTSRFTEELVRNNATVTWFPAHMRDGRFGNFLTEAKDWALSRNRFWGTPLPIWSCPAGHATCVGSFAELGTLAHVEIGAAFDPHRVTVDALRFPCPTCGEPARREPYTIDAWYDSGSAPFAQYHYPFEPGPFRTDVPLDYIAEGLDQTRGWFYTLLVLATLLFHRPAFAVCVVNGLALDERGQKISKSRGNAIDPLGLLDKFGGDAVRWTFLTADFTEPIRVSERLIAQGPARSLITLANVVAFYRDNARADGLAPSVEAPTPGSALDRWMLQRLAATREEATRALDAFDLRRGALAVDRLLDEVSQWYLRRSRPRFWGEAGPEARESANATLSFTLLTLAKLLAPFAPFLAEWVHHEVRGTSLETASSSVHAESWPAPLPVTEPDLTTAMAEVRELVEAGRELRQRAQVKSRIPLPTLVVGADPERLGPLGSEADELLADELNVRAVLRDPDASLSEYPESDWVRREEEGRLVLALARRPTPELQREGWVRETLRRLQQTRKEMGLAYTDPIRVTVWVGGELQTALDAARDRMAHDLLASELEILPADPPAGAEIRRWDVDGVQLAARVERVTPPRNS